MNAISYRDQTLSLKDDETVLDALIREGYEVSYGCRAGVCQSCVMVCDEGEIPLVAQKGLKENQKEMGYFLACQCRPESRLSVSQPDQEKLISEGKVVYKEWLNDHVMCVRIEVNLDFRAGQYVNLWKDKTLSRSYSIASLPSDGYIECHIKIYDDGIFSQWIKNELAEGDTLGVQGAMGLCFYQANREHDLFLSAIGTGLAPVYGIVKDAIRNGHHGKIQLLLGAKHASGFYLINELKRLSEQVDNFELHLVCLEGQSEDATNHDVYQYAAEKFKALTAYKVFLCGAESFVKKMRRHCFMSGANMADIAADSFIQAA